MKLRKRATERIHGQFGRFVSGKPIWEMDWDICCILDACRTDAFREIYPSASEYTSVASTSKTWLRRTFGDRDVSSVGYITANPFAADLDADRFGYFHLEPVSKTSHGIETVEPSRLRDLAVRAWRQRNDLGIDRLVVHFMQPHVPFRRQPEWFNRFRGAEVWGSRLAWRMADGEIKSEEWDEAYRDNLAWVLEEGVEPLAELVDGTIGISADHGNAHGEWGLYGHPTGVVVPSVRKVPWHTLEAECIVDDGEVGEISTQTLTDEETKKQLEALGYR